MSELQSYPWPSLDEILRFQNSSTPGSFLFFHQTQLNTSSSSSTRAPSPSRAPSPPDESDPLLEDLINDFIKPELLSPPSRKRKLSDWVILDESDDEFSPPPLKHLPPSPLSPPNFPSSPLSPPHPQPSVRQQGTTEDPQPSVSQQGTTKDPQPSVLQQVTAEDAEGTEGRPRSTKQKTWFDSLYGNSHLQKFSVCKFFATSGVCRSGSNCKFSHLNSTDGTAGSGGTVDGRTGAVGRAIINEPCRFAFYTAPYECRKGARCPFRHDLEAMACIWHELQLPCRRVTTIGGSSNGSSKGGCVFHHKGLESENDKVEFVKMFRSVLMDEKGNKKLWWNEYLRRDVNELCFA